MIEIEEIFWHGPFSWPGYEKYNQLNSMPNMEGVYLWTFKYKDGYVLYSAGITNSTIKRFREHTRNYKNGEYNVIDVEAAERGERVEIWHGWQYAKMHREEFIKMKERILDAVERQLMAFRIFIAEICDKRKRERIEAALMLNIYNLQEPWAELADRGMFLKGRYNSEIPIRIKNICSNKIYGLPEILEI